MLFRCGACRYSKMEQLCWSFLILLIRNTNSIIIISSSNMCVKCATFDNSKCFVNISSPLWLIRIERLTWFILNVCSAQPCYRLSLQTITIECQVSWWYKINFDDEEYFELTVWSGKIKPSHMIYTNVMNNGPSYRALSRNAISNLDCRFTIFISINVHVIKWKLTGILRRNVYNELLLIVSCCWIEYENKFNKNRIVSVRFSRSY